MPKRSKAALARSRAAKKGWETRVRNARSLAAKKGWKTREAKNRKRSKGVSRRIQGRQKPQQADRKVIQYLVSLDLKPSRGRSYGKRDFLVPATRGASFTRLKQIAQETLTGPERQLLQFFKKDNVTISEGPPTRARKAQLR